VTPQEILFGADAADKILLKYGLTDMSKAPSSGAEVEPDSSSPLGFFGELLYGKQKKETNQK
jgi:hypothetical protein